MVRRAVQLCFCELQRQSLCCAVHRAVHQRCGPVVDSHLPHWSRPALFGISMLSFAAQKRQWRCCLACFRPNSTVGCKKRRSLSATHKSCHRLWVRFCMKQSRCHVPAGCVCSAWTCHALVEPPLGRTRMAQSKPRLAAGHGFRICPISIFVASEGNQEGDKMKLWLPDIYSVQVVSASKA